MYLLSKHFMYSLLSRCSEHSMEYNKKCFWSGLPTLPLMKKLNHKLSWIHMHVDMKIRRYNRAYKIHQHQADFLLGRTTYDFRTTQIILLQENNSPPNLSQSEMRSYIKLERGFPDPFSKRAKTYIWCLIMTHINITVQLSLNWQITS